MTLIGGENHYWLLCHLVLWTGDGVLFPGHCLDRSLEHVSLQLRTVGSA